MQSIFTANDWESQFIYLHIDVNHYFYVDGWISCVERFFSNKYPTFEYVEALDYINKNILFLAINPDNIGST